MTPDFTWDCEGGLIQGVKERSAAWLKGVAGKHADRAEWRPESVVAWVDICHWIVVYFSILPPQQAESGTMAASTYMNLCASKPIESPEQQ
ncbi:hypothetical protein SLA2020_456000 [Shorea laevis]